jgi:hypothetical protein
MSAHPVAHHEIARLRHEERLVRAALATGHPIPADGAQARRMLVLEWLREWAQVGAWRRTAIRVPRLLS